MIRKYVDKTPNLDSSAYVDESAVVMGDVKIGKNVTVWCGAVIRGDLSPIVIGDNSNVQDNCVIHGGTEYGVTIGRNVDIGHMACLHGCTVGNDVMIGIGTVVLNGAVIGNDCILGAGTVVPSGKVIPDGVVVVGNPYRELRPMNEHDREEIRGAISRYAAKAEVMKHASEW